MEFVIVSAVIGVFIIVLKFIFGYNLKKIKKVAENKELDDIASKCPNNIEICKEYLKKLNNKKVTIEENKEAENCLYIAISNKILIGNVRGSFTRMQTIAHECLHSIQDRKLLIFNFVFSNIYILYFLIISILAIFKILPNKEMFLSILLVLGLVYYLIRGFLENDAMIKARYLAKEYMEEKKILDKDDINKLVQGFDIINNLGIKYVNYNLFLGIMVKTLIFSIICVIR